MRGKVLFLAAGVAVVSLLVAAGSASAYYYPSTGHVPPGPPPNYNQVDTSYFMGTPVLPLPPPDDSGGMYVYYDQGMWNIANHIYSWGGSYEQFHCCVLAEMNQPPTPGVNVFIEEFEFWGDTTTEYCLKQNDRWGWIPWGDNLYEIWWDVTTKEWIDGQGDPNDFMRFRIDGCALDFNLWSSGHGCFFNETLIFLGADKTRLSDVPGFWDTFGGCSDPYQSQAGVYPNADPNITIFTPKSDAPRSYNKLGLIDPTDSYSCDLALQYGQRYAGTFAYEGNGVQFSVYDLCPSNHDPNILITPDSSVFLCSSDSVTIWIHASDPDIDDTITVEKMVGAGTYQPKTGLTPIVDEFRFPADTSGVYKFVFRVTDQHGATDEDTSFITVVFNQPPQLTCPQDDSVQAGDLFTSTDYSLTDPDGASGLTVVLHSVSPAPTNSPTLVDEHVEWQTTADDLVNGPDFIITLIATDSCKAADTCSFLVYVSPPPGDFVCPEDDSVHTGTYFISTDFTLTYPDCDPSSVEILDISPSPSSHPDTLPFVKDSHVEWQTNCNVEDYVITLITNEQCSVPDTCSFTVTVCNNPPDLTCPPDGNVERGQTFVSNDFSATDVDNDPVTVSFLDINPSASNDPQVVDDHVEWVTTASEPLGEYHIRLVAADHCGLADTCEFTVTVTEPTGVFECPDDDSVHAGTYFISTDFTLTHPDCDPSSVEILDVSPAPHPDSFPFVQDYHVEWQTNCDTGDYVITLITGEQCSVPDTCSFTVTVYNLPPELTCPDYGQIHPEGYFVSTDFYVSDPFGEQVEVKLLGIEPEPYDEDSLPSPHKPEIKASHVEWQTECIQNDFVITLVATDPCGLADTCEFWVSVCFERRPDFSLWVYPVTQYVVAGQSVGYLVEVNHEDPKNGFYEECSLFVTGLPVPPDSANFDAPVMTPIDFTTLNVYTSSATDTGTYTLTVIGKAMSDAVVHTHTERVSLKVGEGVDVRGDANNSNLPEAFALFQSYPNPFNPEAKISYYLPRECQVKLTIYNALGQRVRTLFDGNQGAGTHTSIWDGRDDAGLQLSSGIYFYRMQADWFVETKKMTLIK
jgi:hypothetical protein